MLVLIAIVNAQCLWLQVWFNPAPVEIARSTAAAIPPLTRGATTPLPLTSNSSVSSSCNSQNLSSALQNEGECQPPQDPLPSSPHTSTNKALTIAIPSSAAEVKSTGLNSPYTPTVAVGTVHSHAESTAAQIVDVIGSSQKNKGEHSTTLCYVNLRI
jgi:hypothetical protein